MSKFACLKEFLPQQEVTELVKSMKSGHTPLWKNWPDYIKRQETFDRSPSTTRSVRDALRMIVRAKLVTSLEDCNNKTIIESILLELKEERGFSQNTYNSYLKSIKCYLIFLRNKGFIQSVDLDGVEKFANKVSDQPVQSDEEVAQVIANLNTRRQTTLERLRNIFFYKVMILTGARPCELERLTLDSLRRGPGQWSIKVEGSKNKPRNRFYNLPSSVKDSYIAYMLYRRTLNRDENVLFVSQSKRTGWTAKGMRYLLKKVSRELGFTVGLYTTRRYVATKLAREGATLDEISDHLGHSRPSTTKLYIQQCGELTRKNVDRLENTLSTLGTAHHACRRRQQNLFKDVEPEPTSSSYASPPPSSSDE